MTVCVCLQRARAQAAEAELEHQMDEKKRVIDGMQDQKEVLVQGLKRHEDSLQVLGRKVELLEARSPVLPCPSCCYVLQPGS